VDPRSLEADVSAFEEWRELLFGIAYRMLGSVSDAEDMVQEACLRWLRRRDDAVSAVRAYLVTIVTRLCMDQLESAHAQRVDYAGPWLPEPVVLDDESSALEQADSLSLAFLVLLEELTPPERAAYLLHDIFGYQFDEIARSLGRTEPGCRQLAARARRRIEDRRQRFDADADHGRELTHAFLLACSTGDLDGLRRLLADDVVVWTDGGGKVRAAMRPVVGVQRSSRFLVNVAKRLRGVPHDVTLNGQPGTVLIEEGVVVASLVLDILDAKVVGVRVVSNPDKLAMLSAALAGSTARSAARSMAGSSSGSPPGPAG
jgi:RNA polymerase sigma-70 factor, ECF subfamily